jgi:hypothetical protein
MLKVCGREEQSDVGVCQQYFNGTKMLERGWLKENI